MQMVEYTLDGCRFALKAPFDFEFLERFGRVFCVFSQNDSGNISFGVENGGQRQFIKVAGPQTLNAAVPPGTTVANLWTALGAYEALRHPDLIQLASHGEVPGGYAAMFRWAPGECLHDHWNYDARLASPQGQAGAHPKYTHPASPYVRFAALPLARRLAALDTIFNFHAWVAECGWVPVDFYDGSILYDFDTHTTRVCDIDLYARAPFTNTMGRMWGSERFISPEECTRGAAIDEVTTVYAMGAAAFALLGRRQSRERDAWPAGGALYAVAKRATAENRAERWPSLSAFIEAWDEAVAAENIQEKE